MKPAPFTYLRPESVDEALDVLAEHGADARVLAGGQSLMAMLNLRLVEPAVLLDISRLEALRVIRVDGDALEVGAAVTQAELERWPGLAERVPFIAKALPWVGHFQTRNRGTVCGSIAHADPSSELPLALALLGGEVVLQSRSGLRRLDAGSFQTGMLQTARTDNELITAVRFPTATATGITATAFREVARRHGDFAIASVGVVAFGSGRLRLGVGGIADRPQCLDLDAGLTEPEITDRIERLAWQAGGFDDIHASARFRRDLVRRVAPTLISEVRACVG